MGEESNVNDELEESDGPDVDIQVLLQVLQIVWNLFVGIISEDEHDYPSGKLGTFYIGTFLKWETKQDLWLRIIILFKVSFVYLCFYF